ncbi:hypothetical protein SBRCBS47491_010226 [Sporothrix bragantina]|uniref:Secreted protein n=1 Tax=Sporothrix bragantina TaxID=671064 RepID=A0ABP0D0V2_9PEZI
MKSSFLALAAGMLLSTEIAVASKCRPSAVCTDVITDGGFANEFDDWSISTTGSGTTSYVGCSSSTGTCAVLSTSDDSSSVTISRPLTLVAGAIYVLELNYHIAPIGASFVCTVTAADSDGSDGSDGGSPAPAGKRGLAMGQESRKLVKRISGSGSSTSSSSSSFTATSDSSNLTCVFSSAAQGQVTISNLNIVCA